MLLIYAVEFKDKNSVFLDKNVGFIVSLLLLRTMTPMFWLIFMQEFTLISRWDLVRNFTLTSELKCIEFNVNSKPNCSNATDVLWPQSVSHTFRPDLFTGR